MRDESVFDVFADGMGSFGGIYFYRTILLKGTKL